MRAPFGAMSRALVPAIRRVQPCIMLWEQIAAPTAPPRCGRCSLQSKQPRHMTRPVRDVCLVSNASFPMPACLRKFRPCVCEGNTKLAGKMIVG